MHACSYGTPTEQGYNEKLSTAFKALYASSGATEPVAFHVDCANGIGAGQLRKLLSHLTGVVDATVCNDGSVGKVNDNCGADYVKTNQKAPPGIEARASSRLCSERAGARARSLTRVTIQSSIRLRFFLGCSQSGALLLPASTSSACWRWPKWLTALVTWPPSFFVSAGWRWCAVRVA